MLHERLGYQHSLSSESKSAPETRPHRDGQPARQPAREPPLSVPTFRGRGLHPDSILEKATTTSQSDPFGHTPPIQTTARWCRIFDYQRPSAREPQPNSRDLALSTRGAVTHGHAAPSYSMK